MKRLSILIISLAIAAISWAAAADWYLYVYSTSAGLDGDIGQFETTDNANIFVLSNCNITASGISFSVHNSAWSANYGWSSAAVSSTGVAVELASASGATGWLSIAAGTYDVIFNSSSLTIQFDTPSGGSAGTIANPCFLRGGDLSMVTYIEDMGAKFKYADGTAGDVFDILQSYGVNLARLRVYNAPGTSVVNDGSTYRTPYVTTKYPSGYAYAGPTDILNLAARAKAHDMKICLSFHLSDFWSNAGTQIIPDGWSTSNLNSLKSSMVAFIEDYMQDMIDQGTIPEYVSIGNETNYGMLFQTLSGTQVSTGGYGDQASQWVQLFNAAYDAVKGKSPTTQVIFHHAMGHQGGISTCEWLFTDLITSRGMKVDIIGGSYYPYWASEQSATDQTPSGMLEWAAAMEAYGKPIMIMETGYSWTQYRPSGRYSGNYEGQLHMNGSQYNEASENGQKAFMKELHDAIATDANILGYMYWDPIFVEQQVSGSWIKSCWAEKKSGNKWSEDGNLVGNTTWFNYSGVALKSLYEEINSRKTYTLTYDANSATSGSVPEADDCYVAGATVTVAANSGSLARTGYTFDGWNTAADGSGTTNVAGEGTFEITAHTTLYAKWTADITTYTITWNATTNGGTCATATTEVTSGNALGTLPTATREGYVFNGWFTAATGGTQISASTKPNASVTYYAQFTKIETDVEVSGNQNISALTINENTEFAVTATGHLTVDEATTIQSLTLNYSTSGHAQITGITDLTTSSVALVWTMPTLSDGAAGHWYAFAVPFEVNVTGGIFINGSNTAAVCGTDFVIEEYDGNLRATKQTGWKRVAKTATLSPGTLYMLYTESVTTWQFVAADASSLTETTSLSVGAYSSQIGTNHSGWNGIAATTWSSTGASLSGVTYATVYDNANGVYQSVKMSEHTFAAAEPFFVQATASGSIAFDAAAGAPWRVAAKDEIATLSFSNEEQTYADKAYLSIAESKNDAYTLGRDLQKIQVAAPHVPQLWLEAYNTQLAAHETTAETTIPVGLYAPSDGIYTLTMTDMPEDFMVSLTKEGQPLWDMTSGSYALTLEAGNNDGYVLQVRRAKDVTTDLTSLTEQAATQKLLVGGQLLIIHNGAVFMSTGARVQ